MSRKPQKHTLRGWRLGLCAGCPMSYETTYTYWQAAARRDGLPEHWHCWHVAEVDFRRGFRACEYRADREGVW